MDPELLFALCVLWLSTTVGMCVFIPMWLWNEGESFHPHAVSVDQRHSLFLVVSSETVCKWDCCVASISAFVAPRGSSGSKNFTVLTIAVAISGILGSMRWYAVGDANVTELRFALLGFSSLILTSLFELDVLPQRFLEDKLRVTSWLIEKLGYRNKLLPFRLGSHSPELLEFLRKSPDIYHLYDEDHNHLADAARQASEERRRLFTYNHLWRSAHMIGAITYVVCVTTAILLNDIAEEKVAWITGTCFVLFSLLGYLTGTYVPLLRPLRGLLLLWNPFLREPLFMVKLQKSLEAALARSKEEGRGSGESSTDVSVALLANATPGSVATITNFTCPCGLSHNIQLPGSVPAPALSPWQPMRHSMRPPVCTDSSSSSSPEGDIGLDNAVLRFARRRPSMYLKIVGHILVFSEFVAVMTPAVAMGIQWITALCDGPPVPVIVDLLGVVGGCLWRGECTGLATQSDILLPHCIVRTKNPLIPA